MFPDVADHLIYGFEIALQPQNLGYSLLGALLGTVIGVIPGLGSAGALALLLPVVFLLDPVGGMIMLTACYSGAMYGGSTASILLNIPGDTSAVVACLDGHQMAKQGRAGPALCIAAIGSYIAGTLAVVGLMFLGPVVANAALKFGPPEYFALMIFGLSAVVALSGATLVKGLIAMTLGLMIASVGTDVTGVERFVFGVPDLLDGIEFLAVTMGLFAVSEVLLGISDIRSRLGRTVLEHRLFISLKEIVQCIGAILRGAFTGFFVGTLPGAGAGIAAFISYSIETQISKHPERFGKGEIKGVAAPESANNAASAGALVPMLSLGIPGSSTTAVMLGAFLALDINPGPLLFTERPEVVWGVIAALYLGNIMLVILNLPLVGIFVRILYVPMRMLLPLIMVISAVGVFSANQAIFDLLLLGAFGALGFYMRRGGYPVAPVILGVVLGSKMEVTLRQSMIMTRGDLWLILQSPIVVFFLVLSVVSIAGPFLVRRVMHREIQVEDV